MNDQLPPKGNFRDGQDFQAMRAKSRSPDTRYTGGKDGACGGPTPSDVWKGQTKSLEGKVKSEKITDQPSNQDRYGGKREAIRKIKPFGKPVG